MSGADPDRIAAALDRPVGEPASAAISATSPSAAPQPLTSLSSLLGGSFEAGQVCDADGNCS
jgi:hypothetical protein